MDKLIKFSDINIGTVFLNTKNGLLYHKASLSTGAYVKDYGILVHFEKDHPVEKVTLDIVNT